MSRPRGKDYISLIVAKDGVQIPAYLRPPKGKRATYEVRWKLGGQWSHKTTSQTILHEARRVAEEIILGKPSSDAPSAFLSFDRFVMVQEKHYARNPDRDSAELTLKKFQTVWADFLRFIQVTKRPIKVIQQVTDQVVLDYLEWLKTNGSKAYGIHSKFGTLRAAWNRVRSDHSKGKKTIHDTEKVRANPWESVWGELPELPDIEPVQLDLADGGEFKQLHDWFNGRPTAQLLIIVSQWAGGRREEITHCEWDWIDEKGYIDIPDNIAKWGKGRVVRIPLPLLQRLREAKEPGSSLVFAGFREEYRRASSHGKRMLPTTADRLYETVGDHLAKAAEELELEGVSHHAIRRTAMELSDQGEEIKAIDQSSRNLGTTTKNKDGFYVRKSHDRTFYLRADRLYESLSIALLHYPQVAELMMVEDQFKPKPEEPPKEKVRRLIDEIDSLSEDEVLEFERQKAKRRRRRG